MRKIGGEGVEKSSYRELIEKVLDEVDEDGVHNREAVVRNLIKIASGKKGSARESVIAATALIGKIQTDGEERKNEFFGAFGASAVNKYKKETGNGEEKRSRDEHDEESGGGYTGGGPAGIQ